MITTLYKPIDDESEKSLERINTIAESDQFLVGLGFRCREYKVDPAFPVIKDYSRAYYLMVSQEMWDKPQPTDEKYFVGVVEDSVDRYKHFEIDERNRRTSYYTDQSNQFGVYMRDRTATVFKENRIVEYVLENYDGNFPSTDIENDIYIDLANEIDAYFRRMILGSYFGGLETWPVANHLLSCFETGGLPCGWIGPEFESGGVPQECMQVMHFG